MPERTLGIAIAEVRFAIEFGSLNERFWQRLDTTFNVVQCLFGMLALAGVFSLHEALLAIAGTVIAVISALQLTLRPLQTSIEFRDARRKFQDLNRRVALLTLTEIDGELEDLRREAPHGLHALERPAFNRVNERHHGDQAIVEPLNWREKFAVAMA
ncbi:MAG: hypothetical protein IV093_04805 [Rubrivivax sp.]|nr:hypothetical protein [Rubrivivax sp.]